MNYKKNVFLLTLLLLFSFMAKAQDIDLIRDAAKDAFLIDVINDPGGIIGGCNDLLTEQEDLGGEGHFHEDYDGDDFPRGQLNDLVLLSKAYALWSVPGSTFNLGTGPGTYNFTELESGIRDGINWWYNNVDYYVSGEGWWWNEIGKQRELYKISVLFYEGLFDASNNNNPFLLTNPSTGNPVIIQDLDNNDITTILAAISADFVTSIQDPSNPSGLFGYRD